MRSMLSTPQAITEQVKVLCRRINPFNDPIYVIIRQEPSCEVSDCFNCVKRKVAASGGGIQYGWAIWEWPRVYLEAEHHAVFSPGSGLQLSDITPDRNTEIRRRLFLPDDSAVYDFENEGIRRDNVRQAIADDHQIEELFRAAARRTEIVNCVPGIGVFSLEGDAAREYIEIERTIERLTFELGVKNSGQNERCICGSGVKFKRCHGQCRVSKR